MSKISSIFSCSNCDSQYPKWSGRCMTCGAWGSLLEGAAEKATKRTTPSASALTPISFQDIDALKSPRISTGIPECDQVLGGGIVPGSLILLGGEPGIGKSTLLGEMTLRLCSTEKLILYCSGEESAQQVKLRTDRLNKKNAPLGSLFFIGENDADRICATIAERKPALAIVDSIQTMVTADIPSEAGSVAQVRACTVKFLATAKEQDVPIIITGHVTKEGMVAGPKTLEHLVDTVLYLESDTTGAFRLLRSVKNRFGSTNEVGVFEMMASGLEEVANPSRIFLTDISDAINGTVTSAVVEGSRAFLIQVQALTTRTTFGYPQRRAAGFDLNRLQLLIAVLSKRAGLNLGDQDIHINVVGGLKVTEPALDLAVCASIVSAYSNKPIPKGTVVFGEVGLSGEVRPIAGCEKRMREAEKLGCSRIIMPYQKEKSNTLILQKIKHIKEMEI